MARWRLRDKHYLPVEGTEWEYKETDQATGRQGRKIFNVPMYLNPEDPADHNYPGEIIVSYRPNGRDYVFTGEPTPDMEPIDDEAERISAKLRHKWVNPIDKIDMNYNENYSTSLLSSLEQQLSAKQAQSPVSLKGVDPDAFAKMQEQIADLMKANADLQAQLVEKPLRRV